MANTVIAIRSSGVTGNTPSLGVLANGELSLNFADGILYYKSSANTLGSIRTAQPSGLNQEIQFNDSGSFGGNNRLTFNKTSGVLATHNLTSNSVATTSYIQFNDGTKQYTANAGGGGGSTNSFGTFLANGISIVADQTNEQVEFVGESGIFVTANSTTNKLVFSVPAGYTFTSADYGYVYENTEQIYDYGAL